MDFDRPEVFTIKKLGERPMPGNCYDVTPDLSPDGPDLFINLYFACQVYRTRWLIVNGSEQYHVSRTLVGKLTSWLDLPFVRRYTSFWDVPANIESRLRNWPVSKRMRDRLVQQLVTQLRNDVDRKDISSTNNVMDFHVKVVVHQNQILTPRVHSYGMIERSIAEGGRAMIPATDLSIQSLESKTLCSAANCPICMDEISAGCKAVLLPCKHPFHRDCVIKWLRTSHRCPNCRYKMPTS